MYQVDPRTVRAKPFLCHVLCARVGVMHTTPGPHTKSHNNRVTENIVITSKHYIFILNPYSGATGGGSTLDVRI